MTDDARDSAGGAFPKKRKRCAPSGCRVSWGPTTKAPWNMWSESSGDTRRLRVAHRCKLGRTETSCHRVGRKRSPRKSTTRSAGHRGGRRLASLCHTRSQQMQHTTRGQASNTGLRKLVHASQKEDEKEGNRFHRGWGSKVTGLTDSSLAASRNLCCFGGRVRAARQTTEHPRRCARTVAHGKQKDRRIRGPSRT